MPTFVSPRPLLLATQLPSVTAADSIVDININAPLHQLPNSHPYTFSSLDTITGTATIHAPQSSCLPFDHVDICFLGNKHSSSRGDITKC